MADLVHVTARIEAETRDALKAMAKARMMKTGEVVTLADMIREGLGQFVESTRAPVKAGRNSEDQSLVHVLPPHLVPPDRNQQALDELKAKAAALVAKGMTQRQVAEALGISQTRVSRLLSQSLNQSKK